LAADALIAALPNMWWDRRFPGETVHRSHGEQVLGDLDKTIGVLTDLREELTAAIDGADARAKASRQAAGLS